MTSVAVVGGGIGGVGALALLNRAGYPEVTVFERNPRVGGVWHSNRYPGAACDVASHAYEFSFARNLRWSRRYAPQAEIQAYIERVAREEGVADRIRTDTEVTAARWDGERKKWTVDVVSTSSGGRESLEFDVLIAACGQLSRPAVPDVPGRGSFAGPSFHTACWPADLEVDGRRVSVIGTGASAIQVVPAIAPRVAQLDVYQRSPGWTIPRMDFAYSDRAIRTFERHPWIVELDRRAHFAFYELGAYAMTGHRALLGPFRAIGRRQITKAISDPELRRRLTPEDEVGCKRILLTDDWYPALARENVELIADRVTSVTADAVLTGDGRERKTDVIVFATGFESHAFVAPMEIAGVGGRTLADTWGDLPRAYLGLAVPDFPNMFLIYGPNTNGGTGSVIFTIESAVRHVISAMREMDRAGARTIEVTRAAADGFDRDLRAKLRNTVWHSGCTNWYLDEDGNDPNQWPWLWSTYRRRTATLIPGAYQLA